MFVLDDRPAAFFVRTPRNRSVATEEILILPASHSCVNPVLDPVQIFQHDAPSGASDLAIRESLATVPNCPSTCRCPAGSAIHCASLGSVLWPLQSFDMLRIHQEQLLKMTFQQVPQRPPILSRRLHRDLGHFAVLQPGSQLLQISCKGAKVRSSELPLSGLPMGGSTQTVTLFLCTSMPQQRRYFVFHDSSFRSPSEGRLELIEKMTFLRVFIRLKAGTTVPGSSKRVLTRFTERALRGANGQPASCFAGGSTSMIPNLSSVPPFSSVLVGARSAPCLSPIFSPRKSSNLPIS